MYRELLALQNIRNISTKVSNEKYYITASAINASKIDAQFHLKVTLVDKYNLFAKSEKSRKKKKKQDIVTQLNRFVRYLLDTVSSEGGREGEAGNVVNKILINLKLRERERENFSFSFSDLRYACIRAQRLRIALSLPIPFSYMN